MPIILRISLTDFVCTRYEMNMITLQILHFLSTHHMHRIYYNGVRIYIQKGYGQIFILKTSESLISITIKNLAPINRVLIWMQPLMEEEL